MAKYNYVMLYALVAKTPKIFKDKTTNELVTGYCPVIVIRGNRDSGYDGITDIRYDTPVVMTKNEIMIKKMEQWRENDIVEIKGVLTTKNVIKKAKCPHCGAIKKIEGCTLTYVTPIFMECRTQNIKNGVSKEDGIQALKSHVEISNQVSILGYVADDVNYYRTQYGVDITQYPIAVNRKYRIKDDDPLTKTDFPWVKSFNTIAKKDAQLLRKGSLVFIDGMIQTREIKRTAHCDECESEFTFPDAAVEVVSYSTEYLNNYNTPEDLAEIAKMKGKKAEEEIFG